MARAFAHAPDSDAGCWTFGEALEATREKIALGNKSGGVYFLRMPAGDGRIVLADDYEFGYGNFPTDHASRLEPVHSRH